MNILHQVFCIELISLTNQVTNMGWDNTECYGYGAFNNKRWGAALDIQYGKTWQIFLSFKFCQISKKINKFNVSTVSMGEMAFQQTDEKWICH